MRRDPFDRFVSCLIYAPRENYTTELRQRWRMILEEAFNGVSSISTSSSRNRRSSRILITVRTPHRADPAVDVHEHRGAPVEAARRWEDDLSRRWSPRRAGRGNAARLFGARSPPRTARTFRRGSRCPTREMLSESVPAGVVALNLCRPLEAAAQSCASSSFTRAAR